MNLIVRHYSLQNANICYFRTVNFRNFSKITGCVIFFKIHMLLLKSKQLHWEYHFTHCKFILESIFSLNSFFSYHFWVPTVFSARTKMRTFIILARWTIWCPYKWTFDPISKALPTESATSPPAHTTRNTLLKFFLIFPWATGGVHEKKKKNL